jgi:ABC-2 type transport system permease protein
MPIHDQSYRRYKGERESVRSAWTVIALTGIKSFVKNRALLGVLLVAYIPFIVRIVQFYVAANFSQAANLLGPSTQTFRDFLEQQNFFVFLTTIYVGSGLISLDRRANALQIYLSKPLTRAEYIAGKMAILLAFILLVTLLPALLLLVGQIILSGSFAFARANLYLFPAITLFSLVEALVVALAMLALSSLSTSSRYVSVMFAGAMFFSFAVFNTLRAITGSTRVSWVSFTASLNQVGDVIFRLEPRYDTPVLVSMIVLVALVTVSISVLERRVRGVEVVA